MCECSSAITALWLGKIDMSKCILIFGNISSLEHWRKNTGLGKWKDIEKDNTSTLQRKTIKYLRLSLFVAVVEDCVPSVLGCAWEPCDNSHLAWPEARKVCNAPRPQNSTGHGSKILQIPDALQDSDKLGLYKAITHLRYQIKGGSSNKVVIFMTIFSLFPFHSAWQ